MSTELRPLLAALSLTLALAATLTPRRADACGPDFPASLLVDRGDTLGTLPEGRFLIEAEHLVTPTHLYPVVYGSPQPDDAGDRERALFAAGDHAGVLALPPAQRHHLSTWAAYLLARNSAGDDAIRAYRRVRVLVDHGYPDVAGLAASSLGQEARLHYQQDEWLAAVRLYAEQAALGDDAGALSLLFVMRKLVADGREGEILGDPVGQRLTATYLATRSLELGPEQSDRLWRALIAIDHLAGADQLASAAYQRGEWDRAAALTARADDTPRRAWVQAKLALRAGDTATADRLLARAEEAYRVRDACPVPGPPVYIARREDLAPQPDVPGPPYYDTAPDVDTGEADDDAPERCARDPERDRLIGERAAVAVADDRMTDALALAWEVRAVHPDDLTYVAERLVTVDELIAFVEALPDPAWAPVDHDEWEVNPAALRALLGRRLMRDGRHAQAVRYLGPSARLPAVGFALALATAGRSHDPIERARALYQASRIARRDGLEILGTAHAPDWELYGAQYDRFAWLERPWLAPGRGVEELARLIASAPDHVERYHYRHLASELAEQAAELLPRQSQARVAMLCWAARHVRHDDQPRVEALYWRATHQAPLIDGMDFPHQCPEPELDRARRFLRPPPGRLDRLLGHDRGARRAALTLAAILGATLLVGLGVALPRRRWRRFVPRP